MRTTLPPPPRPEPAFGRVIGVRELPPPPTDEPPTPPRWRWLAVGLAAAWLSGFVLPRNFTWFLCALPHEMGHASIGCLLGRPSTPAIALHGEAWAGIAELQPWLVWVMALAAAGLAAHQRRRLTVAVPLALLALAVPLLAFSRGADLLIAAGGHLGELAFATWCFTMAWTGGRTGTPQERAACAMAGGLVQFTVLRLGFGLWTDVAARSLYEQNGSLGLKNDLLVIAEDLLACRLQPVAMLMFVAALLPLPLGLWIGSRRGATNDDDSG